MGKLGTQVASSSPRVRGGVASCHSPSSTALPSISPHSHFLEPMGHCVSHLHSLLLSSKLKRCPLIGFDIPDSQYPAETHQCIAKQPCSFYALWAYRLLWECSWPALLALLSSMSCAVEREFNPSTGYLLESCKKTLSSRGILSERSESREHGGDWASQRGCSSSVWK